MNMDDTPPYMPQGGRVTDLVATAMIAPMSSLARPAVLLLALLAAPAFAQSSGDDALAVSVRIDVKNQGDVFLVTEARAFPITVRVEKKDWTNCKSTRTPPFTELVRAAGSRHIFSSQPEQPGKAWRCHVTTTWIRGDPSLDHVERCAFTLPFAPRGTSTVIQGFDGEPTHKGERRHAFDFALPEGTPVLAAREGVVDYVLDDARDGERPEGNEVLILHADGSHSGYAHLQRGSVVVRRGDTVARGAVIARSGRTSSLPIAAHVHFEVFAWQSDRRLSVPFDLKLPDGSCHAPVQGDRF
jgi:murein DD-endopeptidase MepM/ murein hydrolase activator NlpD